MAARSGAMREGASVVLKGAEELRGRAPLKKDKGHKSDL